MNRRQVSLLLIGTVVLGGLPSCGCTNSYRTNYLSTPQPIVAPPGARWTAPVPPPGAAALPPGAVAMPPGAAIQQNSYPPPGAPNATAPSAVTPGVYLEEPEPVESESARPMPNDAARRYPPQTPEPPPAAPPRDDRAASPALPVGIPQFAIAKTNVASGQEPDAEGIAWLKAHGYRTVLHIRTSGEDDSAARRAFEQSSLQYLSLEVSPRTLSKEIVDTFTRLVTDEKNHPLFVYDKDSSLAGGLWYLHFRLADKETDEKARDDAGHLGFRQDQNDAHRTMWVAVQNFLRNAKP